MALGGIGETVKGRRSTKAVRGTERKGRMVRSTKCGDATNSKLTEGERSR